MQDTETLYAVGGWIIERKQYEHGRLVWVTSPRGNAGSVTFYAYPSKQLWGAAIAITNKKVVTWLNRNAERMLTEK